MALIKEKANNLLIEKEGYEKEKQDATNSLFSSNDLSRIANLMRVDYNRPPSGAFDRTKVRGRVIGLFDSVNSKYNNALEAIGGKQLFSVVVDDKDISNQLLKEKCFNCYMSFIPLRDIRFKPMDKEIISRVERKYKDKAINAIRAIKFDKYIEIAMDFIFGSYFICENSAIAKEIIKNESNTQCVTLDGDVYRSTGVISGGYIDHRYSSIEFASIYKTKSSNIKKIQLKINEISTDLEGLKNEQRKLIELESILVEKEDELNRISLDSTQEKRSIKNQIEIKKQDIQDLQKSLDDVNSDLQRYKEEKDYLEENLKKVSKKGTNLSSLLKNYLAKSKVDLETATSKVEEMKMQIQQNEQFKVKSEKEINDLNEQLDQTIQKIKDAKEEETKAEHNANNAKDILRRLENELDSLTMRKSKIYEERNQLKSKIEEISTIIENRKKHLTNLESAKQEKEKRIEKAQKEMEKMMKDHNWLRDCPMDKIEQTELGRLKDYKELKEFYISQNKGLQRHINTRIEAVADSLEEQCKQLHIRKDTVNKDRQNLLETLDKCNIKKEQTVMQTFEKVSKALNSIFSTLLPGTKAKLRPVKEGNILDEGVELSVAFNDIWKNSLSELSGGQRSLLALSFILAMMKYKPAPIYILDEIDAALDLENTQNIGEMIRKHFKNSQFIIVSLKEQMTFNAAAIFRVASQDGKSRIEKIH